MEKLFCWNRLYLYTLSLEDPIPPIAPREEVEFAFLRASDPHLEDLDQVVSLRVTRRRMERGDTACVAYREGKIIAYCWVAFKEAEIGEIARTLLLREGECYLYDAYTRKEFRGKGLYPAILNYILRDVKGKGLCRALICALKSNRPSHQGIRRVGFHLFQVIRCIRLLGLPFCFYGRPFIEEQGIQLVKRGYKGREIHADPGT